MDIAKELIAARFRLEEIERAFMQQSQTGASDNAVHESPEAPKAGTLVHHTFNSGECVCEDCGKKVSQKVASFSSKVYHAVLCFECQKNHRKEA